MDFEHAFQQTGIIAAVQMLAFGAIALPGLADRSELYRVFISRVATYVVTFGPVAILLYILAEVSQRG